MCAVDVASQVSDGLVLIAIRRVCHAWVEVVEFDAELFAALEVVDESVVSLRCACWVRVCKIY